MNIQRHRCRPFTVADAVLMTSAFGAGLALERLSQHIREPLFLWGPSGAGSNSLIRTLDLILLNMHLLSSILSSLCVALVIIRLRTPRPSFGRLMRQPGAVACFTTTAMWALSCAPPTMKYLLLSSWRWDIYIRELSNKYLLYNVLGYAIATSWFALRLSGRWRSEPGWIDRTGTILGVAWVVSCSVFNVRFPYGS
jgi:hypothetical protein